MQSSSQSSLKAWVPSAAAGDDADDGAEGDASEETETDPLFEGTEKTNAGVRCARPDEWWWRAPHTKAEAIAGARRAARSGETAVPFIFGGAEWRRTTGVSGLSC